MSRAESTTDRPLRAAIYTRVSSDPRKRGRSVAEQQAACEAECRANGWHVAAVFEDDRLSASRYARKTRPRWAELVERMEMREFDVLVMWEGSRATRDLRTHVDLRDLCQRAKVLLSYDGRVYDMDDSSDREQVGRDALSAEAESGRTSKRVNRSVSANAASGKPHGKLLYGYRRTYDPTTGEFAAQVPEETEAPTVARIFERFAAGESVYGITRDLNAEGIPGPRRAQWLPVTTRRVLTNAGYLGQRVHRGEVIGDAVWPALTDADTWQAAQVRLTDPTRQAGPASTTAKHLLSGIATCGGTTPTGEVCGARMRVLLTRGVRTYACPDGFHTARAADRLDAYMLDALLSWLDEHGSDVLIGPAGGDDGAAEARREAAGLRQRLTDAYTAWESGGLSAATYGKMEASLTPKIDAADRRSVPYSIPSRLLALLADTRPAVESWADLADDLDAQREVIRSVLTLAVLPIGRGRRGPLDRAGQVITWTYGE